MNINDINKIEAMISSTFTIVFGTATIIDLLHGHPIYSVIDIALCLGWGFFTYKKLKE